MQVTTATRQACIPLGHESGNQPVSSGDLLDARLEERRLVRRSKHVVVLDSGLVDTWSRLRVKAFQFNVESAHRVDYAVSQVREGPRAQNAVAEHPR
jgi:ABC-type enterochelin transport system substrate-binding protein